MPVACRMLWPRRNQIWDDLVSSCQWQDTLSTCTYVYIYIYIIYDHLCSSTLIRRALTISNNRYTPTHITSNQMPVSVSSKMLQGLLKSQKHAHSNAYALVLAQQPTICIYTQRVLPLTGGHQIIPNLISFGSQHSTCNRHGTVLIHCK